MSGLIRVGWVIGGLLGLGGCGRDDGLYPVHGTMLCASGPAEGAMISLYPEEGAAGGGPIARGVVDAAGSFRLESGDLGDGAAPGRYAVLVEWRQGPLRTHRLDARRPAGRSAPREGKALLIADDRLKGRYADIAHPRLHAEVKPQTNYLPPIELEN